MSRSKSPLAFSLRFSKPHSRTTLKNHHQKRRMNAASRKISKADDQLVEKQQEQSVNDMSLPIKATKTGIENPGEKASIKRKEESSFRISKKRKNKPSLLQKAKKTIKRLEVEVAEGRGYTKCLKELAMDEAKVLATAIEEMEVEANQRRTNNKIHYTKNQIINHFITGILDVFEAEDQHV